MCNDEPPVPPELSDLAGAITPGGPGIDGIPPIDQPRFVAASDATFPRDDDIVFGLELGGEHRAYPQLVLVWHEIFNDTVAGRPISVTYCPLTGTAVGFTGIPGEDVVSFGTSGNLVNSNLLMYDRPAGSRWPQILGTAITGKLAGTVLPTHPLVWTTWGRWRAQHPDTVVLTTDTGALRNYGSDPYGSYRDQSGYYADDAVMFRTLHFDDSLSAKSVVLGVRAGGETAAIPKDVVRDRGTVDLEVGGQHCTASWDAALETARVVRADTGEPADYMEAMWFAWVAFYPRTTLLERR
ncbi:DUF3179 domain-containing protein [Lolliginicoccus suaedae]|uniref:DUF3179 domain-containing protein n=1 Tax=Lolliginicoccus suaedae TaxID=2605429 RepID=UPI0011EC5842|nr:DUF3179 domain-containing protein [Lolliginicoccus suaedae]